MSSQYDTNRVRLKQLYDQYRNARMNREYYACRLASYQRINLFYEIVLAVGTSSAVAGIYFLQTGTGKNVWASFGVVVILLSVLKPVLQIPKKVEQYSKLHTGYSDLYYDLKEVVNETKAAGGISPKMRGLISKAERRYKELGLIDEPNPSDKLLRKSQDSVKKKVPSFKEWWPELTAQEREEEQP